MKITLVSHLSDWTFVSQQNISLGGTQTNNKKQSAYYKLDKSYAIPQPKRGEASLAPRKTNVSLN